MAGQADLLGGAGGTIGGIIGYGDTAENRQRAQGDYENALAGYQGLSARQQGPSAYDSMSTTGQSAQLQALGQLQDIYKNQGLDASTRAQLNQTQQSNALQAKAAQDRIQGQMQQQGLASSGANVAAQQAAAQQASQNNYNAGAQAAALGANRQMEALGGAAQIGSNVQGEAAQKAAAQNAINQFNTGQGNTMDLARAHGMASAYGNMAQNQMDQARMQMGFDTGVGKGVGTAAGGAADSTDIGGQLMSSGQGGSAISALPSLMALF